jgi:hypothetical protein
MERGALVTPNQLILAKESQPKGGGSNWGGLGGSPSKTLAEPVASFYRRPQRAFRRNITALKHQMILTT